jgi:hypothetical protein
VIEMAEKREMTTQKKSGFSISDLILVAVLLAAGAVLKLTVGTVVNFFGMKPNFIIAMYCLALLLIMPSRIGSAVVQAAAIGIISWGYMPAPARNPLAKLYFRAAGGCGHVPAY